MANREMSDEELKAAIAAMAGRWMDLDRDLWDVYQTGDGGLAARSVFDGTEQSAFGIIAMGRMVGPLPDVFQASLF